LINIIEADKEIKIDRAKIMPFSKKHSANEPVSYSISGEKRKVSVVTGLGVVDTNVVNNVKGSNVMFLESNHDLRMLETGSYPAFLKQWIKSEQGHLSNYDASLLILGHGCDKLKEVVLSHLSENNNTPELALKTFKEFISQRKDLKNLKVSVSGRYEIGKVIEF